MAFDGVFLRQIVNELKTAYGCRVEKIHQPAKSELVFLLRRSGVHLKLLICTRTGAARIHFTTQSYENPPSPPMFCMLLRKHLCGTKLTEISQYGLDRVISLTFEGNDEMGDKTSFKLFVELTGAKSNLILVNKEGKIIEALRRSDPESEERICLPGAVYTPLKADTRLSPIDSSYAQISAELQKCGSLSNAVCGLSPLLCREFEGRISALLEAVKNPSPTLMLSPEGEPFEFSYCPVRQYGDDTAYKTFASYSELLDAFFADKDRAEMLRCIKSELVKTVNTLIGRTSRKLSLRRNEQKQCVDREHLRIFGELLKANIYNLNIRSNTVTVQNYYSENFEDVIIPVNPALSVQSNAAKYFKDYKKACVAAALLDELIAQAEQDLEYFESVLQAVESASCKAELEAIKEELVGAGVLSRKKSGAKPVGPGTPFEYKFSEYRILVGKNNRQNDILTFKTAGKNDIWLHAKNIAGAHVILFCSNDGASEKAIEYAAMLAAKHSKGAKGGAVSVDYTLAKYVKKPPGAKPGMVTYDKYSTVYIKL